MAGFGDWKKQSVVKPTEPEKETAPAPKTAVKSEDNEVTHTFRPGNGRVIAAGKRSAGFITDKTQSRNIRFTDEQWRQITDRVSGNLNLAVSELLDFALKELERRGEDLIIEIKRKD
jgi:hypothetical protein